MWWHFIYLSWSITFGTKVPSIMTQTPWHSPDCEFMSLLQDCLGLTATSEHHIIQTFSLPWLAHHIFNLLTRKKLYTLHWIVHTAALKSYTIKPVKQQLCLSEIWSIENALQNFRLVAQRKKWLPPLLLSQLGHRSEFQEVQMNTCLLDS